MKKLTKSWVTDSPKSTPIKVQCRNTPPLNSSVCVLSTTLHRTPVWVIEKWLFLPLKWMFCWLLGLFSGAGFCFFSSLPILVLLPIKLSQLPPGTDIFLLLPLRSSQAKGSFILLADPWPSISKSARPWQMPVLWNPEPQRPHDDFQEVGCQTGTSNGSVYPIHKSVSSWAHRGLAQLNQDDARTLAFMPKRNYYRDQTSKK